MRVWSMRAGIGFSRPADRARPEAVAADRNGLRTGCYATGHA